MSLESWKAEFYPVAARDCPSGQEVEHSLRKWQGLRKENLERHGCERFGGSSISDWDDQLYIGGETCALCVRCESTCKNCPLCQFLGGPCDWGEKGFRKQSAYHSWTIDRDPKPMIAALEKTLAAQRAAPVEVSSKEE